MSDAYALNMGRNATEAQRLDEQFELVTKNVGYLLHPEVAATLPPNSQVADVGAGTGIFLQYIQESYPGAILHGFDISAALFPNPARPGITMQTLDVKQPIPEELWGKYDLVHVRLLAAAMLADEWAPAVRNVAKMLRPGGWMQWEECDFAGVKHLRGAQGSRVATARRLGRAFRDGLLERFEHGWNTLPGDMSAAGLASVTHDFVSSDRLPETRELVTANGMRAILSWARLMTLRGAPGALSVEELSKAEEDAYEDIRSGCYVRFDIHIACGRMPES
ncbi:S-adenosyl-L-methionine-dependent methyltransferase [Diaporthe sp. PMI_573]|nr:S-adenosyl-L-methionine-dependent methyltransferase [Diaporthaceae sp. PMI_573]